MNKIKKFLNIYVILITLILLNGCATNVKTPDKGVKLEEVSNDEITFNGFKDFNITISDGFISKMPDIERENQLNYEPWPDSVWINSRQSLGFYLSSLDKKRHYNTVIGALDSILKANAYGKSYIHSQPLTWYNKDKDIMGMVKIIQVFGISGGLCVYYQVLIQKKTKALSEIYLGCKYTGTENWSFDYDWWRHG